ncbi:hypothetical protein [Algirhabdus cladophorae]|uniref:hypothetical protein n=1 Tax=Algirhabdus cladophorae TaxID=3377108 RepID=UPI003B84A325
MKNVTISALVIAATTAMAAPAFANDALARSLGVEAGAFTSTQLVELKNAIEGDDHIRADFIKSQAGQDVSFSTSGTVGVSDFAIETAADDDDRVLVSFYKALNAGEIDGPSAVAAERQAAIQAYQMANEENRGS